MIPIMQPTVSYIKKWGESLHILESSSLTPRFPAWNPNRQCCQVSHRKGRSLGMGLLQFLPCSLGIGLVWYQPFFHFFQPHTSTLTTQTGSRTHSYTPSQIKCSNYYFWSARPFTEYTTWRLPHAHSSDSDPKILLQLSLQMSWKTFFDSTSVDQAWWPNGWTHGFLCFSWAGCLKKINTPTATWLCIPN